MIWAPAHVHDSLAYSFIAPKSFHIVGRLSVQSTLSYRTFGERRPKKILGLPSHEKTLSLIPGQ